MGILQDKGLKETRTRSRVLDEFVRAGQALTQQELMRQLDGAENRVSVYRVLRDFESSGILHRFNNEGVEMYALCNDCVHGHHNDAHIHFNCTSCNRTVCIPQRRELRFHLPRGYQKVSFQLMVKGICAACA